MRDFDVKEVQMTTVAWNAAWHRYVLRREHTPGETTTELLVDDVVMLRLDIDDFYKLRDAMDVVENDASLAPLPIPTKPQKPKPANTGKPWAPADDDALAAKFKEGASLKELADAFGRSSSAINLRLVKLGLVEAGADTWRGMN